MTAPPREWAWRVGVFGSPEQWSAVPGFWTTIGDTTLKYHAWGDRFGDCHKHHREGGFTVWYEKAGAAVGVLTCNADDDYQLGKQLIATGQPAPCSRDM